MLGALVVVAAALGGSFPVMLAGSLLLGGANAAIFLSALRGGRPRRGGRARAGAGDRAVRDRAGRSRRPGPAGPDRAAGPGAGVPGWPGSTWSRWQPSRPPALRSPPCRAASRAGPRRAVDQGGRGPATDHARPAGRGAHPAPVRAALLVLGGTNLVMVAIMAVAPVRLMAHGHDLGFTGLAVSVHVLAMFAPSPATGWLADRFGAPAVAAAGAGLLILAGMGGLGHHHGHDMVALLIVLGLGWNCGVVGGSALLAASVPRPSGPAPRPSAKPPWAWPPPPRRRPPGPGRPRRLHHPLPGRVGGRRRPPRGDPPPAEQRPRPYPVACYRYR